MKYAFVGYQGSCLLLKEFVNDNVATREFKKWSQAHSSEHAELYKLDPNKNDECESIASSRDGEFDSKIKLRYFAVLVDETQFWDLDKVVQEADVPLIFKPNRVEAVYLASPDIGVHLCEAAPSTFMRFVESRFVWDTSMEIPDDVLDRMDNERLSGENWADNDHYIHRSNFFFRYPEVKALVDADEDPPDDAHGETWAYVGSIPDDESKYEELVEYLQGNSVI